MGRGEGGGEEVAGGARARARELSYSLPVTYYELIPTAPVKYYCKILTVICARVPRSLDERARARERTNELRQAASKFLSRCPYPSGIYFVPARDSIVYSSSTSEAGTGRGGAKREVPEIKVLIRGFSRARVRARKGRRGDRQFTARARARISIISRIILRLGYVIVVKCCYYNIVSANLLAVVIAAARN